MYSPDRSACEILSHEGSDEVEPLFEQKVHVHHPLHSVLKPITILMFVIVVPKQSDAPCILTP